jgi:hypothetical protein
MKPMFSIIHPSARPDKWQAIYDAWRGAANDFASVEYILIVDRRWGFDELPEFPATRGFRAVWNTGRRCYVDAVNIGAQYATGDVLIVAADDQFPCENWDFQIAEVVSDSGKEVVEVSTGTPSEHDRRIMVMPVLTRSRYDRLGHVFYPAYESMYADNDFFEAADTEKQIADGRHLLFPHRHPFGDRSIESDKVYEAQNRAEAYQVGEQIFASRKGNNFAEPKARKTIAVCMPGERFCSSWVAHICGLISWLEARYNVVPFMAYCSNVYVTRAVMTLQVLKEDHVDYVLWIDDDNLIEIEHVKNLIGDLDTYQNIDIACGWCHCQSDEHISPVTKSSVGYFGDPVNVSIPLEVLAEQNVLMKIDWTGFPLVLMRRSALADIEQPFVPILNPANPYGFESEDIAFSRRTKDAGKTMVVDPRVKVPHLKLRDANINAVPATAGILKGE